MGLLSGQPIKNEIIYRSGSRAYALIEVYTCIIQNRKDGLGDGLGASAQEAADGGLAYICRGG